MAGLQKRGSGGGAWTSDINTVKRRGSGGGAWADVQLIKRRVGTSWVTVWAAGITGSVSPTTINGSSSGIPKQGTVTTTAAVASGSGGSGVYTYSWRIASVSTGVSPTINTPKSASTTLTRLVTDDESSVTGIAICTISDGTYTFDVSVSYRLSYSSTA